MTKLLSLDQATRNTGYALFNGGHLVEYGVIKAGAADWERRIVETGNIVDDMIQTRGVDAVVIEGIEYRSNMKTYAQLASLQGVLFYVCANKGVSCDVLSPSTWRKAVGISPVRKREEQKQLSVTRARELFEHEFTDDEAEAVLQGVAAFKLLEQGD